MTEKDIILQVTIIVRQHLQSLRESIVISNKSNKTQNDNMWIIEPFSEKSVLVVIDRQ